MSGDDQDDQEQEAEAGSLRKKASMDQGKQTEETKGQHQEYREAIEATKVRSGMSHEGRGRLKEITRHAEKLRKGRRNDPKEGDWLAFSSRDVRAHSATMTVKPTKCWMNNVYVVQGYDLDAGGAPMICLMVQRHDSKKITPHWEILQRIKQQLVGDLLAVEIYPEQKNLIDVKGMYQVWCFAEAMELPFGLHLPGYCIPLPKKTEENEEAVASGTYEAGAGCEACDFSGLADDKKTCLKCQLCWADEPASASCPTFREETAAGGHEGCNCEALRSVRSAAKIPKEEDAPEIHEAE